MIRGFIVLLVLLNAGCAALVDRAAERFANDLETAIREYNEPDVIGDGLPSFLLLLEARINANPDDPGLRLTSARLTATYAALFSAERDKYRRLNQRALDHARTGACRSSDRLCDLNSLDFDQFDQRIEQLKPEDLEALYVLTTTWTGWIDAHSSDYRALADLPRVERLLDWIAETRPDHDDGAVWLYLAVLNSQRPPAAGGQPEKARRYFEQARERSRGRNLLINVLMADSYARLLFDRELYVELLEAVINSPVEAPEYRLVNQVARNRATDMLEQTEDIFD